MTYTTTVQGIPFSYKADFIKRGTTHIISNEASVLAAGFHKVKSYTQGRRHLTFYIHRNGAILSRMTPPRDTPSFSSIGRRTRRTSTSREYLNSTSGLRTKSREAPIYGGFFLWYNRYVKEERK